MNLRQAMHELTLYLGLAAFGGVVALSFLHQVDLLMSVARGIGAFLIIVFLQKFTGVVFEALGLALPEELAGKKKKAAVKVESSATKDKN